MNSKKILIVDDNNALLSAFQMTLAEQGFQVLAAHSGREATALCANREHGVAIAIVDLRMPEWDGPATIEALHQCDSEIKVIAVSGQMLGPYFGRLSELGVRHFLAKPFSVDSLVYQIRELLAAA